MNPIEENAAKILMALVEKGIEEAEGEQIKQIVGLNPEEINDAVAYLKDLGAIEVHDWLGTAPYKFGSATVTPRGKYLYYEMKENK